VEGPGSNVIRIGEAAVRDSLQALVREVCTKAAVDGRNILRTVAGMSGSGRPEARQFLEQTLREVVGGDLQGEVQVVSDAEIALHAAVGSGPGIVVIAGTGSIALARDARANTVRAGGWGWAISDEGSGPWIGRAAVAAILHARDTDTSTDLEERVLRSWQIPDVEQLVQRANAAPPPDFGALLPEVVQAADAGDAFAGTVIARAGRVLALLAKMAADRCFPSEANDPIQVAMSGGVFAHAPKVGEAFGENLRALILRATVLPGLPDPALGALRMAREIG
jgi:N-acetylglucosamine kinase-like BadF-type ATPase